MAFCKVFDLNRTKNSKAYRVSNWESNIIIELRDVEFFENKFSTDFEIIEEEPQRAEPNESKIP